MKAETLLNKLSIGESVVLGRFRGNITRIELMGNVPMVAVTESADDGRCYLEGERRGKRRIFRGETKVKRLLERMEVSL